MEPGSQEENLVGEFYLVLDYDLELVQKTERLGIYSFREGAWQYVGGRASAASVTLKAQLQPFSRYAVFEDRRIFSDLDDHWAKNDVEIMTSRYLISGLPSGFFAPEAPVTQAEFATLLAKVLDFAGIEQEGAVTPVTFNDMPPQVGFAEVVEWLTVTGLMRGYPDATFKPGNFLSREEIAVLAVRLLEHLGIYVPEAPGNVLAAYRDAARASPWSRQTLSRAVALGLLCGTPAGELLPDAKVTRAQAAVIIKRVLEKAELL